MELSRKEFLVLVVGGAVGAACGGSSSAAGGNCAANGTAVSIAQNTGHVLVVSKADIAAGVAKTYDIQGTDTSHTHSVTLTAADMASLAANQPISETSSVNGTPAHSHSIRVSCA